MYRSEELLDNNPNRITNVDEASEITRRQVDDDLRLYGSRLEPTDVSQSAFVPSKIDKSEVGFDRPAEIYEDDSATDNNQNIITAIDWNAGESPLSAWLNQSAIPSTTHAPADLEDHAANTDEKDSFNEEIMEIEVFRNVHMATAPEPTNMPTMGNQDASDLELDAQIYYRNIVDRYPLLPVYLARRLAVANHNRAQRLRIQRLLAESLKILSPVVAVGATPVDNCDDAATPAADVLRVGRAFGGPAFDRSAGEEGGTNSAVHSDFWTRGSVSQRSSSVDSRYSSVNSSLHGSSQFDPQEQNEVIPDHQVRTPSTDFGLSPHGLPPPPVNVNHTQKEPFVCQTCGKEFTRALFLRTHMYSHDRRKAIRLWFQGLRASF